MEIVKTIKTIRFQAPLECLLVINWKVLSRETAMSNATELGIPLANSKLRANCIGDCFGMPLHCLFALRLDHYSGQGFSAAVANHHAP